MAKGGGKILTSCPDSLKGGKGKTVGGEGSGARSFPGEQASNKNDKHEGLKPINSKTIMTEKGYGGTPKGGGPVIGCGKGYSGMKDSDGDND